MKIRAKKVSLVLVLSMTIAISNAAASPLASVGSTSLVGSASGLGNLGINSSLTNSSFLTSLYSSVNKTLISQTLGVATMLVPNDLMSFCYEPTNPTNWDNLCKYLNFNLKLMPNNICSALPTIAGYKKKSNLVGSNVNSTTNAPFKALESFCNSLTGGKAAPHQVTSRINNYSVSRGTYGVDNSSVTQYSNGSTATDYYSESGYYSAGSIVKNNSTSQGGGLARKAYLSNDATTLDYLDDISKSKNIGSLNDVTYNDVHAHPSMQAYEDDISAGAAALNMDLLKNSPTATSSAVMQKVKGMSDSDAVTASNTYVSGANDELSAGDKRRSAMYFDATKSPARIAVPTEETLNLMREDERVKYAALIQKQQMQDTIFRSFMMRISESEKTLVSLSAQKAVIMNSVFDANASLQEINAAMGSTTPSN